MHRKLAWSFMMMMAKRYISVLPTFVNGEQRARVELVKHPVKHDGIFSGMHPAFYALWYSTWGMYGCQIVVTFFILTLRRPFLLFSSTHLTTAALLRRFGTADIVDS